MALKGILKPKKKKLKFFEKKNYPLKSFEMTQKDILKQKK